MFIFANIQNQVQTQLDVALSNLLQLPSLCLGWLRGSPEIPSNLRCSVIYKSYDNIYLWYYVFCLLGKQVVLMGKTLWMLWLSSPLK